MNLQLFQTFRLQSSHEVFSMLWHPLIPLLGQLNRDWKCEMQKYWRNPLNAVARNDILDLHWPNIYSTVKRMQTFYRRMYHKSLRDEHLTGKCSEEENLNAIMTCFLYEWPKTCEIIAKYCAATNIDKADKLYEARKNCAKQCFLIATAKRSADLTELACKLFVIEREDVCLAIEKMCAFGYKGIACLLANEFHCTVDDLRGNNNYALYFAIFNNHLPVVQWLLRMFKYNFAEVKEVLRLIEAPENLETTRQISFSIPPKTTAETLLFVQEWLMANITDRLD